MIILQSDVKPRGEVTVTIRDARGRFVRRIVHRNVVTTFLRGALAQWLTGTNNTGYSPVAPPNYVALGDGVGTPAESDTAMFNEVARKLCTSRQVVNGYYAEYRTVFQASDPNGTFTEAGLLDASSNGNLWAHVALSGVSKATGQTLTVVWKILMQGS